MRPSAIALTILVCLAFLPTDAAKGQPWMESVPENDKDNFYAIQEAFNNYWKDRDWKEKGKGWKAFKRWEWFWEQRVYPSGEFPNRMQLYNEYRGVVEQRPAAPPAAATANWTEMGPSTSPGGYAGLGRLNCVRTNPADPDEIWVGSGGGGLWKTTDNGATWATLTDELPTLGVTDIAFDPVDPNVMYIATGDGDAGDTYSVGVLKSTDAGTTWKTTGLNWETSQAILLSRLLIRPDDPNTLIAAGSGTYKTTDGGDTWVQTGSIRIFDLEFKPSNPDVMYASGEASNAFRSTDGGSTWAAMTNGFPTAGRRVALAVTEANPEYVYALVANASSGFLGLYRTTDGGNSWTLRSNSPNILGWEPNGSDGGGQGWYDLALAASPSNADEIYTGGVNVWKSINGGTTMTISTMWYNVGGGIENIHADQHDLYFIPGTTTLYAGNDGGIYKTTDGGEDWVWIGAGLRITQFYRFSNSQTDADRVIAGAQDNGTKLVNGTVWSDHIGGDGMEALIDYSNENTMYATLYFGDIFRTLNGGGSWTPATGGITESGGWITPFVIDPEDPMTLYGGYNHVWKTTNQGVSWFIVSNFTGGSISILEIAPSDPNVLYAGTSGTIYRTTDGGATNWTAITRPSGAGSITDLVIHALDPNHIWVTSSGFVAGQKVYESFDAGATWTNVSTTLPNVPVNCITFQENSPDRVYAGTDIGVWYRDLTSPDWVEFNEGLANVVITELEMQYSTNKIRACTYGRGVWESDAVENTGAVIGVSQSNLDFGRVEAGFPADTIEVTVGNYGSQDTLTVSSISVTGQYFPLVSLPQLPASIAPGETIVFSVTFNPVAHGIFADTVSIESNATNGTLSTVELSGKGVVIGEADLGAMYAAKDSLYLVDPATGQLTSLGETGGVTLYSISVRPSNHEMYGLASTDVTSTVYRVSSISGDALSAQTFDVPLLRAIAFGAMDTLYGAAAFGTGAGTLYRLDLATGAAEPVGTSALKYSALAFNPTTGELYASERPIIGIKDKIYTVNKATGEATLVGQTGFPTRATAALAFNEMGQLFGITGNGQLQNEFIVIDPATGVGTLIAAMGTYDISALTVRVDSIVSAVGPSAQDGIPGSFVLEQNYPNPFNPATEIRFGLPTASRVTLTIYNMLGQEIVRLVDGELAAGYSAVTWNGTGNAGAPVASGLYFYKLDAAGSDGRAFTSSRKMLLLK
jgi:photosystem II stability/assembly factor-like uncharacterized protein